MIQNIDMSNLTILVVDDEVALTRLVRMMLKDLNVTQVYTAKDGKDALVLLGEMQESIDIVICDWNMPQVNGLELLKQIRTVDPELPFLMLTARADMSSVKEARDVFFARRLIEEQLLRRLMTNIEDAHIETLADHIGREREGNACPQRLSEA